MISSSSVSALRTVLRELEIASAPSLKANNTSAASPLDPPGCIHVPSNEPEKAQLLVFVKNSSASSRLGMPRRATVIPAESSMVAGLASNAVITVIASVAESSSRTMVPLPPEPLSSAIKSRSRLIASIAPSIRVGVTKSSDAPETKLPSVTCPIEESDRLASLKRKRTFRTSFAGLAAAKVCVIQPNDPIFGVKCSVAATAAGDTVTAAAASGKQTGAKRHKKAQQRVSRRAQSVSGFHSRFSLFVVVTFDHAIEPATGKEDTPLFPCLCQHRQTVFTSVEYMHRLPNHKDSSHFRQFPVYHIPAIDINIASKSDSLIAHLPACRAADSDLTALAQGRTIDAGKLRFAETPLFDSQQIARIYRDDGLFFGAVKIENDTARALRLLP